jgi:hypothetical protein
MRAPSFEDDCWRLLDGEQHHREAPKTFEIPDLALRKILGGGDFAKLMFEIMVGPDERTAVERMWVIIREQIPGGYIGMLDNKPDIAENDRFWVGSELPFEYRHIIAVDHGGEKSLAMARAPPPSPGIARARTFPGSRRLSGRRLRRGSTGTEATKRATSRNASSSLTTPPNGTAPRRLGF